MSSGGRLLTSRSLWALMFLYVFGSFGWSFFVTWMPQLLLDAHVTFRSVGAGLEAAVALRRRELPSRRLAQRLAGPADRAENGWPGRFSRSAAASPRRRPCFPFDSSTIRTRPSC